MIRISWRQRRKKSLGRKHRSSRKGHESVKDDIHLFRAANIMDKTLITEDSNILGDEDRRNLILSETGIRVFSVSEALEENRATQKI
ncbi:MAG: hypothetical protein DRH76_10810 [Deltaproteobacteria bacterium]|nr:MAG: hypothetical protein DRH76_10810 [Deltaproteobacteria bacterium]